MKKQLLFILAIGSFFATSAFPQTPAPITVSLGADDAKQIAQILSKLLVAQIDPNTGVTISKWASPAANGWITCMSTSSGGGSYCALSFPASPSNQKSGDYLSLDGPLISNAQTYGLDILDPVAVQAISSNLQNSYFSQEQVILKSHDPNISDSSISKAKISCDASSPKPYCVIEVVYVPNPASP